ncbi:MAG: nitrate reductase molybdenum cofactor assembly chaperone [Alphaproteobacteria bacterium]|nr:nitrate reductase molybdenum cofactor assembly chaperone [Alphaproteobacteria bacterium]
MIPALKILSALLTYPTPGLALAVPEIREVLADDRSLTPRRVAALEPLLARLSRADTTESEEDYVDLFDRSRQLSLHLFEHVHGDSRDRGQAMVDLKALYESGGLFIEANELPDYLPLFLEFLSTRPAPEARGSLGDVAHILKAMHRRLGGRDPGYAAVIAAILAVAGEEAAQADFEPVDDGAEALDRAWEETPVAFGPEAATEPSGCTKVAGMLDRMRAL